MFLTLYNLNNSSTEHENSSFCSFFSTCYSLDALFCLCCRKQNMFSSVSDRKWNVVPVSSEPPTTWQISQIIAKNMKIRCFVLKLNSDVSEEIHTLFFPSLHKLNQSSCLFCRRGWGAFSAAGWRRQTASRPPAPPNRSVWFSSFRTGTGFRLQVQFLDPFPGWLNISVKCASLLSCQESDARIDTALCSRHDATASSLLA